MAANLVDHVLGRVPCRFVGHGGVEVGAAAEKQSREGDKGERLQDGPSVLQPLQGLLAAKEVVKHPNHIPRKDDGAPHEQHVEHRPGHIDAQQPQAEGHHHHEQGATIHAPVFPKTVKQHPDAVQAAPNHEVPRRAVPQAAKQHRVHSVDFRGDGLSRLGLEHGQQSHHQGDDSHAQGHPPASREEHGDGGNHYDDAERALDEVKDGKIKLDKNAPAWCKQPDKINKGRGIANGVEPQQVFYALTGLECNNRMQTSDKKTQSWFDKNSEKEGVSIVASRLTKKGEASQGTASYISTTDAFGRKISIAKGHAYAVKDVSTKTNGEKVITVIDPYDSSQEIVMNEADFMDTFNMLDTINLKGNNKHPKYYH